jgi:hypothetical protein
MEVSIESISLLAQGCRATDWGGSALRFARRALLMLLTICAVQPGAAFAGTVGGYMALTTPTSACDATTEGMVRYIDASNRLELCDDDVWILLAGGAAGADTQVQFNDGGTALGGDADYTWNKTTNLLTITGQINLSDRINITGVAGNAPAGMAIDDLSDVTLASPSNGECLVYNGTIWADASCGGGGATLNGITAATANQAGIANGAYTIVWNWGTLATGTTALTLANTNAAASTATTLAVNSATTGAGYGAQATMSGASNNGYAIFGENTGTTNTGYGVYGKNVNGGVPLAGHAGTGTDSSILEALRIQNEDTNSAGVAGIGSAMTFYNETATAGTFREFGRIAGVADTATDASKAGSLHFYTTTGSGAGTSNEIANMESTRKLVVVPPATQTIVATNTITADACGTIKRLDAGSSVTTNTTDTFTNATAAGCCMDLINIDTTDAIVLDANANFATFGGADLQLGPKDVLHVCSDGAMWYQMGQVMRNQ